ncbi:MAG: alpha/beta hydrolase, partial [Chloroflexota bacterium]
GAVQNPVLQILGSASPRAFGANTHALDERLADGRVVVIDGAAHAAHHTHAGAFVAAVEAFLGT